MPSINGTLGPSGPILSMLVGVSSPRNAALKAAGLKIPQFVTGNFLVDTGATCSCVDPVFVASLGLAPSGSVPMITPSTAGVPVQCNQFDVAVYLPDSGTGGGGFFIGALPVLETSFSGQGIEGLIGRDIIDRCTLVYNGSAGMFTLAY
jgi:hypothetical protein